jgi:SAM-dependent methyltransferase
MFVRLLPQRRLGDQIKLHLGCFDQVYEGWINTDITPHLFVARIPGLAFCIKSLGLMSAQRYEQHKRGVFRKVYYLDVTKRFPLSDQSVDWVFSSHMLEHLTPSKAACCVKEVFRVLKLGGGFRIAVPDLDILVGKYDPHEPDKFCDMIFESEHEREKNHHKWHYNENSLRKLLERVGFRDVCRCEYRKGRCPDVQLIDSRPDHSLFIEASK